MDGGRDDEGLHPDLEKSASLRWPRSSDAQAPLRLAIPARRPGRHRDKRTIAAAPAIGGASAQNGREERHRLFACLLYWLWPSSVQQGQKKSQLFNSEVSLSYPVAASAIFPPSLPSTQRQIS
jgi:hypothetical protein